MRAVVIALVLAAIPVLCSASAGPRNLTGTEKKAVAAAVTDELKDPASAQFKWPKLQAPASDVAPVFYCGLVNAKNSYGGYTGYSAFEVMLLVGGTAQFVGMDGTDEFGRIGITARCASAGYDLAS